MKKVMIGLILVLLIVIGCAGCSEKDKKKAEEWDIYEAPDSITLVRFKVINGQAEELSVYIRIIDNYTQVSDIHDPDLRMDTHGSLEMEGGEWTAVGLEGCKTDRIDWRIWGTTPKIVWDDTLGDYKHIEYEEYKFTGSLDIIPGMIHEKTITVTEKDLK